MTAEEIRDRYLQDLRALWRTLPRLAKLYETFPDAPISAWREGIAAVAERLTAMSEAELVRLGGTRTPLRNLLAAQMGLPQTSGSGDAYGHRVLDISW